MSESLEKRRDRPLGRAPLNAMLGGHVGRPLADGPFPRGTSNFKESQRPRETKLGARNSIKQRDVCCSIVPAIQLGAPQISLLKQYWPRHFTTGYEQLNGLRMRQCVILLLMAAMTTSNFCSCLESLSGAVKVGRKTLDDQSIPQVALGSISEKLKQPEAGELCPSVACRDGLMASARNQPVAAGVAQARSLMAGAPGRELMVAAASDRLEPLQAAESKKKKKMMKKKKKMEKKHKEWKKGKKHKKKKYESKKKKGGSMKKKKGKKEKKKWGKEMKGHKKKGNFKKKKWGHKKKMKKGHKKGKKGHKMLKDKGHKKKGFKKVYHKEEWGKKKKWHDIKREKKWNTKQKKWKKKWHQEKGKKYKGKHMKKYKKENKHGKKYKKEKKSKWKKHKGEKFKKGHKKKKEEYSKKKEGGKKKKMKKEMKKMKKKKG